jgi:hypothetical protein
LHGLRLVAACRIYELRHGRLPETLDTLVPELLETVPRDPYDGKPFPYVRDQALVYSIGGDLKDSGGTVERGVEATPVFQTAEPSDDPNWPEYSSSAPKSLLLAIPSRRRSGLTLYGPRLVGRLSCKAAGIQGLAAAFLVFPEGLGRGRIAEHM